MTTRPAILFTILLISLFFLGCAGANLKNVASSDASRPSSGDSQGESARSDAYAPNDAYNFGGGAGADPGGAPAEEELDSLGYTSNGRNQSRQYVPPSSPPTSTQPYTPPPPPPPPPAPPPGTGWPAPEPPRYDTTYYQDYGTNRFIPTEYQDTSTFGMDVDTASYVIARRYLMDGNMPDPASVRVEEFINYFDQDYPHPRGAGLFTVSIEGAESQFGYANTHILRIGVQARDYSISSRPSANMVFVVDVSGSMAREDRLEQVKRSLAMLANNLKRGDRIGLVVYGTTGREVCGMTSNHDHIVNAINQLVPGGSTNAWQGLQIAYDLARRNYDSSKINRIILCSDGVANTGITDPDLILRSVKSDALNGIGLTTIGFGMGNYNDVLMEKLANHGDGMYFYVDSEAEANRVFGDGATQMLMVIASDAKIQVEFNEGVVDRYRLLGYENRGLTEEQFRDDTVDAGEVGASQSVTALYEIILRPGNPVSSSTSLATVRVRYEDIRTRQVEEYAIPVSVGEVTQNFERADNDFRFTAAVAEFAEILRHSEWARDGSLSGVLRVAQDCAVNDEQREFCDLVTRAIRLEDR